MEERELGPGNEWLTAAEIPDVMFLYHKENLHILDSVYKGGKLSETHISRNYDMAVIYINKFRIVKD